MKKFIELQTKNNDRFNYLIEISKYAYDDLLLYKPKLNEIKKINDLDLPLDYTPKYNKKVIVITDRLLSDESTVIIEFIFKYKNRYFYYYGKNEI